MIIAIVVLIFWLVERKVHKKIMKHAKYSGRIPHYLYSLYNSIIREGITFSVLEILLELFLLRYYL
jgi:hypothetical protein